jgi:hypothetical protein
MSCDCIHFRFSINKKKTPHILYTLKSGLLSIGSLFQNRIIWKYFPHRVLCYICLAMVAILDIWSIRFGTLSYLAEMFCKDQTRTGNDMTRSGTLSYLAEMFCKDQTRTGNEMTRSGTLSYLAEIFCKDQTVEQGMRWLDLVPYLTWLRYSVKIRLEQGMGWLDLVPYLTWLRCSVKIRL